LQKLNAYRNSLFARIIAAKSADDHEDTSASSKCAESVSAYEHYAVRFLA